MSENFDQVDLTNCDREPIHQLGKIQDFGALVSVNSDWFVAQRSANVAQILGEDVKLEQGMRLKDVFSAEAIERLSNTISPLDDAVVVERIFGIDLMGNGKQFDCALHRSGSLIIIEFEPHPDGDRHAEVSQLRPMMAELEPHKDVNYLCDNAARQLKKILGFDRVMVYRFHADDSGEVIAEAREPELEGFLRLRYPKTDIPAQARQLYLLNPFRIIADVDAEPVPIEPATSFDGEPLDLSFSSLRAVSPIHIEYLKNMGVGASLSISIIVGGKLWGLFACHHYSAKILSYPHRSLAELYSQFFSLVLERLLGQATARLREKGRTIHHRLMAQLASGAPLVESLATIDMVIGQVIAHDGMSAYIDGTYKARGKAPAKDEFRALTPILNSATTSQIIATDELVARIPAAQEFADKAVGALIIPVSRRPRDYLVFWRKELKQQVMWAGNPEKPVEFGPNGARLTPRKSFEAWQEDVSGKSARWTREEVEIAESLRVTLLEVILRMTDDAVQNKVRAQQQQELLISELNHRVRNILNLIRSLVSQSRHEALSVADFSEIIGGRIGALAKAHDNITRGNWSHASVHELIRSEAEAYLAGKIQRVTIEGRDRLVAPEAYTVLALVIHEMMTNSAKYGSLCDSNGTLTVTIGEELDGDMTIKWVERGGPPVTKPERRGFGSTITEKSIPFELQGEAKIDFKLEGVEGYFVIPQKHLAELEEQESIEMERQRIESAQSKVSGRNAHLPKHILVIEDSMIIALETEECLKELGIESIDIAGSVGAAMEALDTRTPDLAILDYNLGSESSEPVAKELRKRGIPFVLATGYDQLSDRLDEIGAFSLLKKPYSKAELDEALTLYVSGDY
ncbi:HWE histidine kinase domain-containing protein [Altererythrobacter sp. MF3-039]|uniref:HWE histidine kinase domain-containing protein n=1 Tax=Altererythrobacter sp. MF3-039 TaxID=3252901 RepID=UPI00390C43E0